MGIIMFYLLEGVITNHLFIQEFVYITVHSWIFTIGVLLYSKAYLKHSKYNFIIDVQVNCLVRT